MNLHAKQPDANAATKPTSIGTSPSELTTSPLNKSSNSKKASPKIGINTIKNENLVTPLFLFPFCGERVVAAVLLWLSLLTGLWMLLGPSVHGGERLHDARYRVASALLSDPLSWVLLGGIIFSGFRALNTGIAFRYNAETAVWYVSSATVPIFPGVVGSSGDLDFAVAVAFFVLVQSCRHSVGRLARMAFLLLHGKSFRRFLKVL